MIYKSDNKNKLLKILQNILQNINIVKKYFVALSGKILYSNEKREKNVTVQPAELQRKITVKRSRRVKKFD